MELMHAEVDHEHAAPVLSSFDIVNPMKQRTTICWMSREDDPKAQDTRLKRKIYAPSLLSCVPAGLVPANLLPRFRKQLLFKAASPSHLRSHCVDIR